MKQQNATPAATPMNNGTPIVSATPASEVQELPKTDVVMVGIGASGGIAAHVLTQAGLKVVAIEAGPRLDKEDFLAHYDELEGNGYANWTGEPKFNHEMPTWRRTADSNDTITSYGVPMANMVGGTSVHYTSMSWRTHEDDFRILSSTIERYGEDALPEGSALADWPVTYDDLEPYYDKVEYAIGVSGAGGANPFEAPRARDYPMPPLQQSGFNQIAHDAMETLGYSPFPGPSAIASEDYNGRSACTYCGYCTGHGCWNDSKSSTLVSTIPEAEATGNLEIRPNCRVFRVLVDEDGRASGVEYRGEDGQMYIQPAGIVMLSAYTFENVRLLLLSKSEQFPDGLSNNHGQVGKHYTTHAYPTVNGYIPGTNLNKLSGTGAQATCIDDFNADNFDHTGLGFIRGGLVQASMSESSPIGQSAAVPPSQATWGSEYKRWVQEGSASVASLFSQFEVLPYENNYLDLDPEVTDREGVPVIRITYDLKEDEKRRWDYMRPRMEEILREMGATETWSADVEALPMTAHDVGGARAGNEPDTSVVDRHLLSHEVPNLAIMGGAAFPSLTAGFNPTQTIQAWAWFTAEHIAENFDSIANVGELAVMAE